MTTAGTADPKEGLEMNAMSKYLLAGGLALGLATAAGAQLR